MGIIPIDITQVPYEFDITLSDRSYKLVINYNVLFDFFTIDLILDDITLVKAEKLVINQVLFREVSQDADGNINPNFPTEILYIGTEDKSIKRVSYDNLGTTVFLYYVERDELE